MYNHPKTSTYTLPAAALSTAATLLAVMGPKGHKGRLVGIGAVVTTGVTVAATEVQVGNSDSSDAYGALSVPVSGANSGHNDAVINPVDDNLMPADEPVIIATTGTSTAGAANVTVTIDWFE